MQLGTHEEEGSKSVFISFPYLDTAAFLTLASPLNRLSLLAAE